MRTCEAQWCDNPVVERRGGRRRLYCSDRCRKREGARRVSGFTPAVRCEHCNRPFERPWANRRFCDTLCVQRSPNRFPLSPALWEYLAAFDRALRERTEDNWRRFRELGPGTPARPGRHGPRPWCTRVGGTALAAALATLEQCPENESRPTSSATSSSPSTFAPPAGSSGSSPPVYAAA